MNDPKTDPLKRYMIIARNVSIVLGLAFTAGGAWAAIDNQIDSGGVDQ